MNCLELLGKLIEHLKKYCKKYLFGNFFNFCDVSVIPEQVMHVMSLVIPQNHHIVDTIWRKCEFLKSLKMKKNILLSAVLMYLVSWSNWFSGSFSNYLILSNLFPDLHQNMELKIVIKTSCTASILRKKNYNY